MARKTFDEELADLKARVLEMADHARGMFEDGAASLEDLDEDLAEDVDRRKHRLAELDYAIEEEALQLVARQQPMAGDMRFVGACLKLITYINRVGRYGKDLAQITLQWPADEGHLAHLVQIPVMVERVLEMYDLVIEAFEAEAGFDMDQLLAWEDDLDASRWGVFRECLTYMAEQPEQIEPFAYYMMIARYLERSGDNVCKMAEKTHYMVTGEHRMIK